MFRPVFWQTCINCKFIFIHTEFSLDYLAQFMRTTYTQVPNSEIEAQELSYPTPRPYCLSIPWSAYLIVTTLSVLFNVVLVTSWLRWKDGGLCREALYCEFIYDFSQLNVYSPPGNVSTSRCWSGELSDKISKFPCSKSINI